MSRRVNRLSLPIGAAIAAVALAGCGSSSSSTSAYHPPDPNAVNGPIFHARLQGLVSRRAAQLGITATQVTGVVECMISQFQTEGLNKVSSVMAKHAAAEKQALDQCVQQVKGAAGASGSSGSSPSGSSGSGGSGSSGSGASGSGGSGSSGSGSSGSG